MYYIHKMFFENPCYLSLLIIIYPFFSTVMYSVWEKFGFMEAKNLFLSVMGFTVSNFHDGVF